MTTMKELVDQSNATVDDSPGPAPEPGMEDPVVNTPSADEPFPAMIKVDSSAGWTWVYRTDTGEPVHINGNMKPGQLAKRFPQQHPTLAGKLAFTDRDPGIRPKAGQFKCELHIESPERAEYEEMGLPACKKSNLINRFQVTQHMKKSHKTELGAITQVREDLIADEDRQVRRAIIATAAGAATVVAEPVTETSNSSPEVKVDTEKSMVCDTCGDTLTAKNQGGLNLKKRSHDKKNHN